MNIKRKARILIAVCCKDKAPIELTQCLTNINRRLDIEYSFTYIKGALVNDSRNAAVKQMLEGSYTHLMFIDDDIQFPPDAINRLVDMKTDIASGIYVSKEAHPRLMAWDNLRIIEGHMIADQITDPKAEGAEAVGMGFCLIRRKVFEDVIKEFNTVFFPLFFAGEDLTFCYLAKQCGYHVDLDTNIDLYHVGAYYFGLKDYE